METYCSFVASEQHRENFGDEEMLSGGKAVNGLLRGIVSRGYTDISQGRQILLKFVIAVTLLSSRISKFSWEYLWDALYLTKLWCLA